MSHPYPTASTAPLLAALINLRDAGPAVPANGICPHIYSYVLTHYPNYKHAVRNLQHHLMETWPDSSGDSHFPVDGYEEYFSISADKWSNPRRIALLHWMIAQLEGCTQS